MIGDGGMPRPSVKLINIDGFFSKYVIDKNDLVGATFTRDRTFLKFLDAENFYQYGVGDEDFWNSRGVNPDPNAKLAGESWAINRKVTENKYYIEYELVSPLELENVSVPRRQIINNYCPWKYRGKGCGYYGPPMSDANDAKFPDPVLLIDSYSRGEWVEGESYNQYEYVFINTKEGGSTRKVVYVCLKDHTSSLKNKPTVSTEHWTADQCSKSLNACKLRFKGDETEQLPFGGFPGSRLF